MQWCRGPACCGLLIALALVVRGGYAQEPGPADDAPPRDDRKHTDVYLDDSFEANEMFADARRLAGELRWDDAARVADRLLSRYGEKLVQFAPDRYRPIGDETIAWMRNWPADGLAAYQRLFEEQARQSFASALGRRDAGALYALFDRYFCTRTGIEIGDALAQIALEEGDFRRAADLYLRLWDQHPNAPAEAARIAGRLALVEALSGAADAARRWSDRALAAGATTLRWMGQDKPLATLIDALLANQPRPVETRAAFAWPIFGGEPERNRVVDFRVQEAASLWRFDELASGVTARAGEEGGGRTGDGARLLGMNPIVAQDLVIVHDALQAWAVRIESGKPAWNYSAFDGETVRRSGRDGLVARWHAPTYHDGRVYLCMGSESVPYYGYEGQDLPSTLVCLDAASGRELWRTDRTGLEAPFSRCDFDSTPLINGGKVFVVVRRRRSFGFEDAYLCRFDAYTGKVEFRTHLGSASTGGFGYRRATMALPTLVGGDVVVLTNLGALARVSPWNGRAVWLTLYERQADAASSSGDMSAWQHNPVLSDGRRLVALPLDAGGLLVADPGTGEVRQTIPLSSLSNVVSLLGIQSGVLYGVGDGAFAYDLDGERMLWTTPLPADERLYGRGCLTADQVLVPTRARLCVFSRHGDLISSIAWEAPEDAGNVLATPDQLLVVARDRVSAYARKQDVWDKLHARMAAAPDDPSPALDFAEVALRGSDAAEALAALEEAIRRAGGFVAMVDASLRQRVFEDCLALAQKIASSESPDLELAVKLLGYAAQCTPDIEADVIYRVHLADLHLRTGRPEQAVELYQQMLTDRSLREVPLPASIAPKSEPGERATAGTLSRDRIGKLIDDYGPRVYARFEARAAQNLEAGVRAADLALLERVVENYPNASAAATALIESAEILRRQAKPLEAVHRLALAYGRYAGRIDAPELMRRIADAYAEAGRPESAWRWLTRAAREFPSVRLSVDGRRVSFEEYRDRLGDIRARVEPARPRMSVPLNRSFVQEYDYPFDLLEPFFTDWPGAAWDGYYVYGDARLQLHDAAGGAPRWAEPAPCRMKPDLLFAAQPWALFATRHQIFALDPADGRLLWHYGKYPADIDDALADHERFDFFRAFGLGREHLIAIQDDGRIACLALADGRVVWDQPAELRPSGSVAVSDLWIAYAAGQAGSQVLRVLDLASGEPITTIELSSDRRAERLAVSLEDHLLVFSSQALAAYDPRTGERRWLTERRRNLLAETVRVDLDGVYFSDDGRHLTKLGTGGRVLWQSDPLSGRPTDGLAVEIVGAQLIVSTERKIESLDAFDGRTLWEGTLPEDALLGRRAVTDAFVVAVDVSPADAPAPFKAFFFDHRGGSGRLAAEGGVLELGALPDLRSIAVRDHSILISTERGIHGWHK